MFRPFIVQTSNVKIKTQDLFVKSKQNKKKPTKITQQQN